MALTNRNQDRWADMTDEDDDAVVLEPLAGPDVAGVAAGVGEDERPRLGRDRVDHGAVPEYRFNAGPGRFQQPEGPCPPFTASRVGRPVVGSGDFDSVPETALHYDIFSARGSIALHDTFDVTWIQGEIRRYMGRIATTERRCFINMLNKLDEQRQRWLRANPDLSVEQRDTAHQKYKNVKAAINDAYVWCAGAHCLGLDSKLAFRHFVREGATDHLFNSHKKIYQGLQRRPAPQTNANEVSAAMQQNEVAAATQPSKSALRRERMAQRLAAMDGATPAEAEETEPASAVHEQAYVPHGGNGHLQPEHPVFANGWQAAPVAAPMMYQYVIYPDPYPVLLVPTNVWFPYAAIYAQPT